MEYKSILKTIPELINKTFPIPLRFRSKLPSDIAELSRLLTSNRGDRSLSYLNRPNFLSAYLYYYLPWNLYRLCLLLPSLGISFSAGDTVIDLGSGTLTFVSALWIASPDLRVMPLEFYCVDRSGQALEAGKKFFTALSGDTPWKINLVKEEINIASNKAIKAQKIQRKAKLVSAVNIFNEIYERVPNNDIEGIKKAASNAAHFMCKHAISEDAYILTVEPGVPQSGRFISFLREAFLEIGSTPISPCTHNNACPLTGGGTRSKKWCHFANEDFDPPKELVRLSAAAKLPKERLVYSYLLTKHKEYEESKEEQIRVISDAFPLPDYSRKQVVGRYGCCEKGLVLLTGNKVRIDKLSSGSIVSKYKKTNKIDEKSGAVIMEVLA